jgi:hypothetical protein
VGTNSHFELIEGQSCFFVDGAKIYATVEQAFLFDAQTGTLVEHGPENAMIAKHKDCVKAFQAVGIRDCDLLVIGFGPEQFDAQLFTRFVNEPGILAVWYAAHRGQRGLKKTLF